MKKRYVILFILLVYLLLAAVPYIPHKKVSEAFRDSFSAENFYSDRPGCERAAYLDDNNDALLCRLKLIAEAREELIFSTFDFNADESGKDMMAALLAAADRGVRVRMLIDGFSGLLDVRNSPWFAALASHENISLRIYNPVNLLTPWKLQARLHDKYLIADRSLYLLGGRNTMDLFLGEYSSSQNIDRDLLVYETADSADASIHSLVSYFEQVWALSDSRDTVPHASSFKKEECESALITRSESLKKLYPQAYQEWDWEQYTFPTNKITLISNPIEAANKEPLMWYTLRELLSKADEAVIYTPYIICGSEMYRDLTDLCEKTDISIITNDVSSGANPWGCTDYLNQKERIHRTGVTVYEYLGEHSCHTKALVIDDRLSLVGSYNLDMRSTYLDTELMLAVDSPQLNQIIRTEFERDKAYCRVMDSDGTYRLGEYYTPRAISTGKKIFYGILRVLTIPIRRFL